MCSSWNKLYKNDNSFKLICGLTEMPGQLFVGRDNERLEKECLIISILYVTLIFIEIHPIFMIYCYSLLSCRMFLLLPI